MMSHDWCTSSVNIQVSSFTELSVLKVSGLYLTVIIILSHCHSYHQKLILLLLIEYVTMPVVIWWIVHQLSWLPVMVLIVIMY